MGEDQPHAPSRPRRLCPTELKILSYIARHEGKQCSKGQIAKALGKSERTIDRQMHRLRAEGYVVSEARWDDTGRQLANAYILVPQDK